MGYSNHYGGVIFTNHALQRLYERGVSREQAWHIIKNSDNVNVGKNPGTTEFEKRIHNSTVTVVTKLTEKKEILILSVLVRPPFPGTLDAKRRNEYWEYRKAPWWKKILLSARKQLGV